MSEDRTTHTILTYTQKDVANTAVSVSSLAALGATVGTFIAPGAGSVIGGLAGGLAGLVVERYIDRRPSSPRTTASSD
jgi:outer membrane lipoprotein SlyB